MIRLSVSDLETFRYWKDNDEPVEALIAQLRGQAEPSHEMQASRAFHQLLETIEPGAEIDRMQHPDGWLFEFDLDCDLFVPKVRELKAEVPWKTPSGPVTLVGKVDHMSGLTVADYKLSERFEAERYTDSFQWRAYLAMFKCRRFVYHVFDLLHLDQTCANSRSVELDDMDGLLSVGGGR